MKQIEIFVRHDAELDAFGYFQHIYESNPEAALRFLEAIDRTVEGLASQPLKGRARKFRGRDLKNIRSWRVDDFENYLIFYRFIAERLEILRIKHGAMDFPKALRQH
ncbi:MAG: toxin ParE1/3/4 [Verrucomicrobiota bacterium]